MGVGTVIDVAACRCGGTREGRSPLASDVAATLAGLVAVEAAGSLAFEGLSRPLLPFGLRGLAAGRGWADPGRALRVQVAAWLMKAAGPGPDR